MYIGDHLLHKPTDSLFLYFKAYIVRIVEIKEDEIFINSIHYFMRRAFAKDLPQQSLSRYLRHLQSKKGSVVGKIIPFFDFTLIQIFKEQKLDNNVKLFRSNAVTVQQTLI